MSEKSVLNRSLKELMEMSEADVLASKRDDIARENKLQFMSAYADCVKKANAHKRKLQSSLMDVEHFDVNVIIGAEIEIENQERIRKVLEKRFKILFPDTKLDVLN